MSVEEPVCQAAVDLDDIESLRSMDAGNMIGLTLGFPHQCRRGLEMADAFDPASLSGSVSNILLHGLGAAGSGGAMLRRLFEPEMPVPVLCHASRRVPGFVNRSTLLIASCAGGHAPDTLDVCLQARERGAKIVCITGAGPLAEWAEQEDIPWVQIPGGQPPRAAFGFFLIPAALILNRLGLLANRTADLEDAILRMENLRSSLAPNIPLADNQAKLLARRLYRKIALIYGTGEAGDAVACRWKRQFNENSKSLAFQTSLTDLLHSELAGWRLSLSQAENLAAVFIRSAGDGDRAVAEVEAAKSAIFGKAEILEVWMEGESALTRLMTGAYLGDFASLYLAFLNRVDPSDEAPLRLPTGKLSEAEG